MKHIRIKRPDQRSVRLAASYLAIIMILCTGFSVAFYQTSTKGLNLSLHTSPEPSQASDASTENLTLQADEAGANTVLLAGDASGDTSKLNAQLEQQVQAFRQSLMQRLLFFNVGALIAGAAISYFLARRTLQPIEATMELQARFSSDASHELRTPLAALRARSEVALHDSRLTLTEAKRVIKDDIEQTHKLERLAEGLLRLGREDKAVSHAVSLQEIANEAMNTVMPQAQSRHITIDEHVPHVKVLADQQGLAQVVAILLENAIKYSPRRSIIHLDGTTEGRHAILSVGDEGVGIHHKDLPHIFERFYRADTSRSKPGHGLGLSIAQKIITQHGGTITAESTVGVGSVFTIKLPLARL